LREPWPAAKLDGCLWRSQGDDGLLQFSLGHTNLAVDKLHALTTIIFGGAAEFVPELNKLRSVNKAEPTSQGSGPPPYVPPPNQPIYAVGTLNTTGPQPVKPEKPKAELYRPGWAR
jgi:hypothetical protein